MAGGTRSRASLVWCLAVMGWSCGGVSEAARQQSQANVNLARGLYADEHNPRGAIEAALRAVQLDPENAEAHFTLGTLYGAEGLFSRARGPLTRAVELFNARAEEGDVSARATLAEARNTLGATLVNLGDQAHDPALYDEALRHLQRAVGDVLYRSPHLAWGNIGLAYIRKRDYQRAVEALDRAVALQPDFCVGFDRLGIAYYHLNDYGRALASLNRALGSSRPGCADIQEAYLFRAKVHIGLHQPNDAAADLRRCVTLGESSLEGRECAELGRSVGLGNQSSPATSGPQPQPSGVSGAQPTQSATP